MTANFAYINDIKDSKLKKLIDDYEFNLINGVLSFNYGNHSRMTLEYITRKYISDDSSKQVSGKIVDIWKNKIKDSDDKFLVNAIDQLRVIGNASSHVKMSEEYEFGWVDRVALLKYLWYSLNYIFKNKSAQFNENIYLENKVYLNNDNIINFDINLKLNQQFNGTYSKYNDFLSNKYYKLFNWTNYALSWNKFIEKFKYFYFSKGSYIKVSTWEDKKENIHDENNIFKTAIINEFTSIITLYDLEIRSSKYLASQNLELKMQIFHDNTYLYLAFYIKEESRLCANSAKLNINIKSIIFK